MAITTAGTHLLADNSEHHEEHEEATLMKSNSTPKTQIPSITYLYIILCASANILFGYENSVIAQAKLDFSTDYPMSDDQTGFLTGMLFIFM